MKNIRKAVQIVLTKITRPKYGSASDFLGRASVSEKIHMLEKAARLASEDQKKVLQGLR